MPSASFERTPQLVLAFDYGTRRIGAACGDTLSRTASPLAAVENSPAGPRWERIDALLAQWQPAAIVIGLPYHADGSASVMGTRVRGFAGQVESRYHLPVHLVDERYSSLEAASRLRGARASGALKRRVARADVDAAAACVILERWFIESP